MRIHSRSIAVCSGILVFAVLVNAAAHGQVVNPADKQKPPPEEEGSSEQGARLRSFELPPILIEADRLGELREEDRIGSYGQPRWTATRRFPTTRVYVVPEGKVEFEYWTRIKTPRDGPSTVETQYELEFGLPNRFMLDLYWVAEKTGSEGETDIAEQKIELRYALADWGKLWGNPTLYAEYVSVNGGADVIESKLLLGDEITTAWHWGSNLVWEREIGDSLANNFELTGGVSRTISDEKFSLGAEFKLEFENEHSDRDSFTDTFEIGPSLQYRPMPGFHLDFAPLVGIGPNSRKSDIYFVFGYEF
jgi:hypothetical protein